MPKFIMVVKIICASMLFIYVCVCVYMWVPCTFFTRVIAVLGSKKKIVNVCGIVMLFFGLGFVRMFSRALLILASDNLLFGRLRHWK